VKKIVLPLFLLFVLFSGVSCLKNSTACAPKSPASELAQIQAYCATNGITPTIHPSGLVYQIIDPGSGATATMNSKIVITYTGKLVNGSVFDQRTTPNNTAATGTESPWAMNRLIEGWQVGIPLIQKGGRILLVVPSSMGYSCSGYGMIPGNSILFFDITLVDVL
jgi:FKBP-type peptidyl-prolyl cis-trans isomerase